MARAKAINEELGLSHKYQLLDLLVKEPSKHVQEFINSQFKDSKPQDHCHGPGLKTPNFTIPGLQVDLGWVVLGNACYPVQTPQPTWQLAKGTFFKGRFEALRMTIDQEHQ